jgi:hypothetical protein
MEIFFEKFTRGCHKRMGDIVRTDRALSVEILCAIMHLLELDWLQSLSDIDRWWLSLEGTFYLVAFCCALRGEEVPLVDLSGVQKHFASSIRHSTPHTIVALLGRFKNETGDSNYHLLPIVSVTQSGLEPRRWLDRALLCCNRLGHRSGPLFFDVRTGTRFKASAFEASFHQRLLSVQCVRDDLIGASVRIEDEYGISRSLRRGATSRAIDQGLPPHVVNANNRWRTLETAGARKASMAMQDHYTDVRLTVNLQLQFSRVL